MRHLLVLVIVAACIFFAGLGRFPLLEPDEGRNAEVAREMLVSGDWLTPHFNTLPYLDKPAVFFWLVAGAFRLAGISEGSARFPSALAALGTMILAWFLARRMFGDRTGLRAGIILATCPLVIAFSRLVIFDMTLTFLVTLAMVSFWLASSAEFRRAWWDVVLFAAMGAATITKGPVGFLLPLLSILVYALLRGKVRDLKRLRWGLGGAVFLATTLPWFLAVTVRYPDFPRYAFWQESLQRFASGRAQRPGGIFYYLPVYLAGFFPWSFCLLFAGWNRLRRWKELKQESHAPVLYLMAWGGVIFAFFSISQSKLPGYFLPAIVPLSILMAHVWKEVGSCETRNRPDWLTGGFAVLTSIGLLVSFAGWQVLRFGAVQARVTEKIPPVAIPLLKPTLIYSGLILVALGIVGRNLAARTRGRNLSIATFTLLALTAPLLVVRWLAPLKIYVEAYSSRRLARTILASPEKDLPLYGFYYFRTGLPFYLRRPVGLVTSGASEMSSNYIVKRWAEVHRQSREGEGSRAASGSARQVNGEVTTSFNGLLIEGTEFSARVRSSSQPTLVLLRNGNAEGLIEAFRGDRSPVPLWNQWQDGVWEIPAGKP